MVEQNYVYAGSRETIEYYYYREDMCSFNTSGDVEDWMTVCQLKGISTNLVMEN